MIPLPCGYQGPSPSSSRHRPIDPDALSEAQLRELFPRLLAFCEESATTILAFQAEAQRLKHDIARLKGEHGPPDRPSSRSGSGGSGRILNPVEDPNDHSSEEERRAREARPPRKKRRKLCRITIDRTATLNDFSEGLPADARFKGYAAVVIQDLVLKTDNVRFLRAKFWSPSPGEIRFWDYLRDRLTQGGEIPPLAELIAARAAEQPLGASWSVA